MKIQPIDSLSLDEPTVLEPVKPVVKSRLKRLFERQFLRNSAAAVEKVEEPVHLNKDVSNGGGSAAAEFEPSSDCLAKMIQNFIEDNNDKQSSGAIKCDRKRCNCFNGNCNDSTEDDLDSYFGDSNLASSAEACEILKSLVPCASVSERNLLADTAKIVEKAKICIRKDEMCRKIVTDGLLALGYDASICKSRWDKSPSYPAGEYEYIDVVINGERLIVDIDFRSEFEIARSTKTYKSILQTVPNIFVGKADRLKKIIGIVSEAAKQSLEKKGMHVPPWRKAEYIKAKWLSPHARATTATASDTACESNESNSKTGKSPYLDRSDSEFGEKNSEYGNNTELGEGESESESVFILSESSEEEKNVKVVKYWKPPEIKPKSMQIRARIVTGLASVFEDHQP